MKILNYQSCRIKNTAYKIAIFNVSILKPRLISWIKSTLFFQHKSKPTRFNKIILHKNLRESISLREFSLASCESQHQWCYITLTSIDKLDLLTRSVIISINTSKHHFLSNQIMTPTCYLLWGSVENLNIFSSDKLYFWLSLVPRTTLANSTRVYPKRKVLALRSSLTSSQLLQNSFNVMYSGSS